MTDGPSRTTLYDPVRQRHVAATPEEHVRQAFIAHIVNDVGYPIAMIANEVSITLNSMRRRCDTVVYSREGLRPLMIIEYKAPEVALTQRVFEQIVRYNLVLGVEWLVVSNGRQTYCCRVDKGSRQCEFMERLPRYEELETGCQKK